MRQLACGARLAVEPLNALVSRRAGQVWGQEKFLDREPAAHCRINGLVDDIVRPRDLAQDAVLPGDYIRLHGV